MLHPSINSRGTYGPFLGRDWRRLADTLDAAADMLLATTPRRSDYTSDASFQSAVETHRRMEESLEALRTTARGTYAQIAKQYSVPVGQVSLVAV